MVIVKPFLTYYIGNCMLLHLLPYHLITPVLHLITVMYYHVITLVITCYYLYITSLLSHCYPTITILLPSRNMQCYLNDNKLNLYSAFHKLKVAACLPVIYFHKDQ